MDHPGFLIEHVKPGVEGGIRIEMPEMGREFEPAGLEFGAEKIDDGITPDGFEGFMMEIDIANPALVIQSQTADGGGKMDMEVAFEIASESVVGRIDAREEMFLNGDIVDNAGWDRSEFVEKMAVEPEKRLKLIGERKNNVLPGSIREYVKSGFDPIISVLFTAGGTETRFTGVRRLDRTGTFWTDKDMPAEQRSPAGKHFKHIDDNGRPDQLLVTNKEFPPIAVINEDVPDFNLTADEFHRGNIVKLNVDER
jgi:hypothetical protein